MAKGKGIIVKAVVSFVLVIVVYIGVVAYMEHQKKTELYKHGFQLLEEQTALYIKENYTGVSKIAFSPIFKDGGILPGDSLTLNVVPLIYDNYGNKATLGGKVENVRFPPFGTTSRVEVDFSLEGEKIVFLNNSYDGLGIEIWGNKALPTEAKLSYSRSIDDNIDSLISDGQLKGVSKSDAGSPNSEIIYNLEIKRGDYTQWP